MKNLDEFAEMRGSLAAAYDRFASLGMLPLEEIDEEALQNKKQQLLQERFIVGVCGQMKAGKSTLLNALVFGQPILPSEVSVMTAKLTVLRHGSTPTMRVTFYNEEEWQHLKAEAEDGFREAIEGSMQAGVYAKEWIQTPSRLVEKPTLDSLVQYVGTQEHGGIYAPFVREVEILHPAALLDQVSIVDTPGLNDPNEARSNRTKNWIHQANAVLYLTFAGAALDRGDVDFINKNLMHVKSSHRILVVNKMDTVEDESEVRAWLAQLRETGSAAARAIFDEGKSSVVYCCGIGALIEAMIERNDTFTDVDLQEQRERLEIKGFLDAERHQVKALRALIEEKLVANKGKGIVDSHRQFILSLFQRAINIQKMEVAAREDAVQICSSSLEELEIEKAELEATGKRLADLQEEVDVQVKDTISEAKKRVKKVVIAAKRRVIKECRSKMENITDVDDFATMGWTLRDVVEDVEDDLWDGVNESVKLVEEKLDEVFREAVPELQKMSGMSVGMIGCIVDVSIADFMDNIHEKVLEDFRSDKLEAVTEECVGWWSRLFNTSTGRKAARRALMDEFEKFAETEFGKSLVKHVTREIDDASKSSVGKLVVNLNKARADRKALVTNTLENMEAAKGEADAHRASAEAARARMKQYAQWKSAEEARLGVA